MQSLDDARRLDRLKDYFAREGALPTYQGIAHELGYASTSPAAAFVNRQVASRFLKKSVGGRVIPGERFFERPLADARVPAGHPVDLDTSSNSSIDIDRRLIRHPSRTFVVQVEGDSMVDAGLLHGDFVVAERESHCRHRDVVVALVDGRATVKYLWDEKGRVFLRPANKAYQDIWPRDQLQIMGLVVGSFRKMV